MHKDVKQCADNGDIKGLRYIFVDSLDVDPTFEKYREDFDYCQKVPRLFETHTELSPFILNESRWDNTYWEKLKVDLLKNFSLERFQHMMKVAQIVYAEKIKRISLERQESAAQPVDVKSAEKIIVQPEKTQTQTIQVNESIRINKELQEKQIEEEKRKLYIQNQDIERKEREQKERIERRKAELGYNTNQHRKEDNSLKKVMGIVLLLIIIAVLILVMK